MRPWPRRDARFRKLYEALGLRVVGHKDGTLAVFRTLLPVEGEHEGAEVAL